MVEEVLVPDSTLVVEDQYIVKINTTDYSKHIEMIKSYNFTLLRELKGINGYSCSADKMNLEIIKNLKEVVSIEADTIVKLNRLQEDPPYHLSRLTSGRNFNSGDPYSYDSDGGSGVTAYIIDSGIDVNHNEFGGRAEWGTNMLRGTKDRDNVGHGTHVAGIIGSETYGVAKAVKLVAIKVFDPSANSANSDVIAAIDWVIHNHSRGPAIINLSLSSSYSTTLNSAVEGAIRRGINVVVAGGNSNADACDFSPSSARGAIVVGATTSTDARARYSNYGNCLSLFAPGDQILSTWPGQSTRKMSGTSMATPFVVGLSALLLSKGQSSSGLLDSITSMALSGVVRDPGSRSPNLLAHYDS